MRFVSTAEIASSLTFPELIEALAAAFRADINVPARHHHALPGAYGEGTLLLMPAWTAGEPSFIGIKAITIHPGNLARGLPSQGGGYLLLSGETGKPLALFDARMLTLWRTAAASALAARFLARAEANLLCVIGAGALAPFLARAHALIRPVREIAIWNRTAARAESLAADLRATNHNARAVQDLEAAVRSADIVTCVTSSSEPLVRGTWLRPGTHLDLVGGFKPTMREADDDALTRARIYVDTRQNALKDAGDLVDPMRRGIICEADIAGDLFDLCRGKVNGRSGPEEITLFKSVGTAVEDLATAMLIWRKLPAP
jgi:ornithine cyclodeaminase